MNILDKEQILRIRFSHLEERSFIRAFSQRRHGFVLDWHLVILVRKKSYNGLLNINNKLSAFESVIHKFYRKN